MKWLDAGKDDFESVQSKLSESCVRMRPLSYVSSSIPANIIMSEQMSDKCQKINGGDAAGDTPTTNLRIALLQILHRLQEALLAKVRSDPETAYQGLLERETFVANNAPKIFSFVFICNNL